MRKTISVDQVVDTANWLLANSTMPVDFRKGVAMMIEQVLFDSKRYAGFRYLNSDEVVTGQDLDEYRRFYMVRAVK